MNKALPIVLAALLAIFAVVVFYVTPRTAEEAVELRVYAVPHEYHEDIMSTLRYALGSGEGEKDLGRVTSGPNDTLVVTAPLSVHRGVEDFLKDLENVKAPQAEPAPISLNYWFVVGRPMESGEGSQYKTSGRRSLKAVEPALERIAAVQGPTEFRLLEKIQLNSVGHDRAESRGKFAMVEQRATRTPQNSVVGDVMLTFDGRNQMRSQIMLEPNQVLVLGQAGFAGNQSQAFGPREDISDATLYYVVTSDLER